MQLLALLSTEPQTHPVAFFCSMHDNRWEGEKEEDKEKGDKPKTEEVKKEEEEEEEKPKPPTAQKVNSQRGLYQDEGC